MDRKRERGREKEGEIDSWMESYEKRDNKMKR